MSQRQAPDWLAGLQARFGSVIRTPLDRTSGTLTATPERYDPELRREALDGPHTPGSERLAVYNRQYWFRLFGVLQTGFTLTTRLVGHWRFNDYAARFLLERPPQGWDIDRVTDDFDVFFVHLIEHEDAPVERQALIDAVRIDAAWHRVFRAPAVTPYRPSADDATRLLASRLVPSPAVALIEEHWPLLELRKTIENDPGEAPVPLPARLAAANHVALVRRPDGMAKLPLEAREAELFRLLRRLPLTDALAELEASCGDEERAELPSKAQRWLARSVALDFWVGIEP